MLSRIFPDQRSLRGFAFFLTLLILTCAPSARADVDTPGYAPWSPKGGGNCKGSALCNQIKSGYCLEAISFYDNYTVYYKYTSFSSRGHTWGMDYGCAAMYKCTNPSDFGAGMTGKELKEAFALIYDKGVNGSHCGRCGSHTVQNPNCWVTLNQCRSCVDTNGGDGEPLQNLCPPLPNQQATGFLPWNNSANATGGSSRLTQLFGTAGGSIQSTTVTYVPREGGGGYFAGGSTTSAVASSSSSILSGPPVPATGQTLPATATPRSSSFSGSEAGPRTTMPANTNGLTTSGTPFGGIGIQTGLNNIQSASVTVSVAAA